MQGSLSRLSRNRHFQIGIILWDREFVPHDWNDAPRTAILLEHGVRCRSLAEAESWIFGYNSAALAGLGGRWAILLKRGMRARPGDTCVQSCAQFQVVPRNRGKAVA